MHAITVFARPRFSTTSFPADASYEAMAPAHAAYALALAACDLILPISATSGDDLTQWWQEMGHSSDRMPPVRPILLAAEVIESREQE
jgi:hypothetical protein